MTFPVFVAAGAAAESASGNISPAWPVHEVGDVALLLIESGGWHVHLTSHQGFRPLPGGPVKAGTHLATSATWLHVYWCRATSEAMPAPTIKFSGDHIRARILTFRGLAASGRPWCAINSDTSDVASSAVSMPSVTTTEADSLIVGIISTSGFLTCSGYTNPNLANITEILDESSAIGNGSGFIVFTGEKAAPGATGNTTATLSASGRHNRFTIALTAVQQPSDPSPFLKGIGTPVVNNATDVAPAWPEGHESGDLGLLIVEYNNGTVPAPSGWTELVQSPQQSATFGTGTGTGLAVFWKRATSSAEAAPTVVLGVNEHLQAMIITLGSVIATGHPIHRSQGDATATAVSTITFPEIDPALQDCLVLCILGHSIDADDYDRVTNTWSNANIELVREYFDRTDLVGNGSGIAIGGGVFRSIGPTGPTTATFFSGSSHQARISVAIHPAGAEMELGKGSFSIGGKAMVLTKRSVMSLAKGALTLGGKAMTVVGPFKNYTLHADKGSLSIGGKDLSLRLRAGRWTKDSPVEGKGWTKDEPL